MNDEPLSHAHFRNNQLSFSPEMLVGMKAELECRQGLWHNITICLRVNELTYLLCSYRTDVDELIDHLSLCQYRY